MTLQKQLSMLSLGLALTTIAACSSDSGGSGDGDGDGTGGMTPATGTGGMSAGTGGMSPSSGGSNPGTGGTTTTTGGSNPGTGGAGGAADVCAPFASFEDGPKGFWVRKNEGAASGDITPAVTDFAGEAVTVDPADGANDTSQSFGYSGTGFDAGSGEENADGAPGGINIANDMSADACGDASAYTGISIYAKGTTAESMKYGTIAADTVIVYLGDGTNEMSYRAALPAVATEWGEIQIAFDDAGWYAAPAEVDLSAVTYVKLLVGGKDFDVSFDEIGWYK